MEMIKMKKILNSGIIALCLVFSREFNIKLYN